MFKWQVVQFICTRLRLFDLCLNPSPRLHCAVIMPSGYALHHHHDSAKSTVSFINASFIPLMSVHRYVHI